MLVPISPSCLPSRAGIRALYLLECQRLQGVTFSASGKISAMELVCQSGQGWVEYRFSPSSAFFEQSMTRSGPNTPTRQTLGFNVDGVTAELRDSVVSLKKNCCLLAVVLDGAGNYMLAGVSSYRDGVEFRDLRLSSLDATTGQDVVADVNTATFSFTAEVNCLAPFLSGSPVDISTDCGLVTVYGPVEGGDIAWGPVEDGDTAWGPVQH